MDPEASQELDVRKYLRGVARRKGMILLVVLVALAIALAVSVLESPLYQATAQILLQAKASDSLFNVSAAPQADTQVSVSTEIQVIESPPVRAAVAAKLGPVAKVAADQVGQTLVVEVKGEGGTAKRAAAVTNAYTSAYTALRKRQAADDLLQAGQQLTAQISSLQSQIDGLNGQMGAAPASSQAALAATVTSLSSQQDALRQRLDEVQVDASLASGGVQLVSPATPPRSPVQPTPVRDAILALMAGLLLGIAAACLLEFLDDSIRTSDDLQRASRLPFLASIPSFAQASKAGRAGRGQPPQLVLDAGRNTPAAEAYRSLRTAVQLLGVVKPLTVIQFSSPAPAEGKTTTVVNLAIVLADAGHEVVVVDCDLRRPMVHHAFGVDNTVGLTSVLLGDTTVLEAVQAVPGVERLFTLTAGALAPNPSELLSLKRTSEIIFAMQDRYAFVLLDSPPVLPVTDAVVLSEWVEAVVLITSSGVTKRKALQRAIQLLKQTSAPVAGVVLNRVESEEQYSAYAYESRDATHSLPAVTTGPRASTGEASEPAGEADTPDEVSLPGPRPR